MGHRGREIKRRRQAWEKIPYTSPFTWAALKKRPLYFFLVINAAQCFILPFFSMKFLIPALFGLVSGAGFIAALGMGVYCKRVEANSNTYTLKDQPIDFVITLIVWLAAYIFATVFPTLLTLQELSKNQP